MPHRPTPWKIVLVLAIALVTVAPGSANAAPAGRAPVSHVHATARSTSVRLTWHDPGGRHFAATVVRYAKGDRAPRRPTGGMRAGRVPAGRASLTVRHLRPATHYAFALFAYYGSGRYGRRVVVRAVTAPDAVRLVQPFDHHSYVAVTWRAPRASTYAAAVVRYAAGRRAPSSPAAGTGVRLAAGHATEARLANLQPRTAYSVSVWLRDRRHQFSPVATTHFTTLGAVATPSGVVSGTVTDRSAHPLKDVDVELSDWTTGRAFSTTTGADGAYRFTVAAGEYGLAFNGTDATGGTTDATGYLADGRTVVVRPHATRTEDAALEAGAAVSGRVTDPAGHPLHGVAVYANRPNTYVESDSFSVVFGFDLSRAARTAADGTFVLRGLPAEAQQPCYDTSTVPPSGGDFDAVGYAGRCMPGTVAVTAGTVRTLAPMALVPGSGGTVSGTVTDSAGRPAAHAIVEISGHDSPGVGTAYTDASGRYRIGSLPPGRYDVCVDPGTVPIAAAATGDTLTCRFAVADVHPGGIVTVDLRLQPGAAAAGRLIGPGGYPVVGAQVYLREAGGENGGSAITDGGGQYEVKNLAPGRYTACFDPTFASVRGAATGVRGDCFGGGEVFEVRRGVVRLGIDANLRVGGAVSGTVVSGDAAHAPVAGAEVTAERVDGDGGAFSWAMADDHGHYTITGLPTGRYEICAMRMELFDGGAETCRSAVRVTAGRTTGNADVTLSAAGSLTVAVQDADGHPVSGVDAVVVTSCGPDSDCNPLPLFAPTKEVGIAASAMTGADGTVTFSELPPTLGTRANYAVCVFTFYGATTAGEPSGGYLDDCTTTGTFGLKMRTGPNPLVAFTLQPATAVAGQVTDAGGHPLAGVRIQVSESSSTDFGDSGFQFPTPFGPPSGPGDEVITDADGRYLVLGVQPGSRTVCFDTTEAVDATGAATPAGFLDQCVGGDPGGTDDATPVTVPAVGPLDLGTFRLTPGAAIAGRVLSAATGRPLPEAEVIVFDDLGEAVAVVVTDRTGAYRADRLLADDDVVCFWAEGYRLQCYDGVAWSGGPLPAAATRVTAAPGVVRVLKDARLKRG